MSDYLYIVFPRDAQPTVDETEELKKLSGARSVPYAVGFERKSGGLVIAFRDADFGRSRATDRGFAKLVRRWEVRGAASTDHCSFVKDPTALRPTPANLAGQENAESDAGSEFAKHLAAKELVGKEAIGRALIGVQRALDRYSALQRLSPLLLCLWIAVGTLAVVLAGYYIADRLMDSDTESRRESTVRMIDDALQGRQRDK